ncbi:MAG: response regulator transcription factor [Kineosporiaceae bacterium]
MEGGPETDGTAQECGTPPGAADLPSIWTEEQALDLVARQGYSYRQAERLTGFAADWLRTQRGRPRQAPADEAVPHAGPRSGPRPVRDVLTSRETDVLQLAGDGLTTVEIAERLGCSERTVKMALHDVVERFGLRNRTHAVAYAIRAGLI